MNKKTILAVLLAMSMILALCAACGGNKQAEAPVSVSESFAQATPAPTAEPAEETPAPTEAPAEVTPEPEATPEPSAPAEEAPQGGGDSAGQSGGNTGSQSGGNSQTTTPTEPPAQDKYSVALDMIGSGVDELYAAIGRPNSSSYTESCLVLGGEDGFLEYGDFTVATIRRADGSELVYDVY